MLPYCLDMFGKFYEIRPRIHVQLILELFDDISLVNSREQMSFVVCFRRNMDRLPFQSRQILSEQILVYLMFRFRTSFFRLYLPKRSRTRLTHKTARNEHIQSIAVRNGFNVELSPRPRYIL